MEPFVLTAKGTPKNFKLTNLTITIHIVGYVAETVITAKFLNDTDIEYEGEVVFPIDKRNTITGFAVDINGALVNAVITEKETARVAFESEKREMTFGTSIIEQAVGNAFRTRIYPIPKNGSRIVQISFLSELNSSSPKEWVYSFPLLIPNPIDFFDISILAETNNDSCPYIQNNNELVDLFFTATRTNSSRNCFSCSTSKMNQSIMNGISIAFPKVRLSSVVYTEQFEENKYFFVLEDDLKGKIPEPEFSENGNIKSIAIFWDCSRSRYNKSGRTKELELIKSILASLQTVKLFIIPFHFLSEDLKEFTISDGNCTEIVDYLNGLNYDGGSVLDISIISDVSIALIFTDGIFTFPPDSEFDEAGHGFNPKFPCHFISDSSVVNHSLLRSLATRSGGQFFDLNESSTNIGYVSSSILSVTPKFSFLEAISDQVVDTTPLAPIIITENYFRIAGRILSPLSECKITLLYGTSRSNAITVEYSFMMMSAKCEGKLLGKYWASKRVKDLEPMAEYSPYHKKQMLDIGKQFSIVTSLTSFLVLETLEQYIKYRIEPPKHLPMHEEYIKIAATWKDDHEKKLQQKMHYLIDLVKRRKFWWNSDNPFVYVPVILHHASMDCLLNATDPLNPMYWSQYKKHQIAKVELLQQNETTFANNVESLTLNINIDGNTKLVRFPTNITMGEILQIASEKLGIERNRYAFYKMKDQAILYQCRDQKDPQYYDLKSGDSLTLKKKFRPLKIKLMDDTVKTILIEDGLTIGDAVETIGDKLGISNAEEFSLKHENGEWLSSTQIICQEVKEDAVLLFQKKFYVSDSLVTTEDPIALHLLHVEISDQFMRITLPGQRILNGKLLVSEQEAIHFAALHAQANNGNYDPNKPINVNNLLPPQFRNNKEIAAKIAKEHKKMAGMNEENAKYRAVQLARANKTYGMTFFETNVKQKSGKAKPVNIGFTRDKIVMIDKTTKEILQEKPIEQLRRWATTDSSFTMDFGDHENEYVSLSTKDGEAMSSLIAGTVDLLLKKQRAASIVIKDEAESIATEEDITPISSSILANAEVKKDESGKDKKKKLAIDPPSPDKPILKTTTTKRESLSQTAREMDKRKMLSMQIAKKLPARRRSSHSKESQMDTIPTIDSLQTAQGVCNDLIRVANNLVLTRDTKQIPYISRCVENIHELMQNDLSPPVNSHKLAAIRSDRLLIFDIIEELRKLFSQIRKRLHNVPYKFHVSIYPNPITTDVTKSLDYISFLKYCNENANIPPYIFLGIGTNLNDWNAFRSLTTIPEVDLADDPQTLRILALKMEELGKNEIAVRLYGKVKELRPEEPQSYRDLAVALSRRCTKSSLESAVQLLTLVIENHWDIRFAQIEAIAVTDLNRIVQLQSKNGFLFANEQNATIDSRLILPVKADIRIVIRWDADMTDVGLIIEEPGEQLCHSFQNHTPNGGFLSKDMTRGYGPIEYMIKLARVGEYTVKVRLNSATLNGVFVSCSIYTDFGGEDEEEKITTVWIKESKQTVRVATITVNSEM